VNIFVLDEVPKKAAEYHCDKHVCKMILESGQMLCTAHWVLWLNELGKTRSDFRLLRDAKNYLVENIPKNKQPPWSMTHVNHPCSVWTRESISNYKWHLSLMSSLLSEYTLRYKRIHKAEKVFTWLSQNLPPGLPDIQFSRHPICMPDDCKIGHDVIASYRKYYKVHKKRFAKWKTSEPHWW
jgi:hypothetical protein